MRSKLRIILRIVIILAGVSILVYPSLSEYLQRRNVSRAVANYDENIGRSATDNLESMLKEAQEYNKLLSTSATGGKPPVNEHGEPISLESYNRMLNVSGNDMMGYISIPKLNTTNRIFHGTEEAVLQEGVGHLKNTSLPVGGESTHAVVSGHRGLPSADLFTGLDHLEVGDVFYIKVLDRTLCYTVDQILTVLPDDTAPLAIQEGKDYFTLVTCTPYGVNSHRLLVRGVRTPFDDTKPVPVYESTDVQSFWVSLPAQYKHLMIGAAAVLVFLFFWILIRFIIKKFKKKREQESPCSE